MRTAHEHELLANGVPTDEIGECMSFAFGENWESLTMRNSDQVWRDLHPDLTPIYDITSLKEGSAIIAKEYLNG